MEVDAARKGKKVEEPKAVRKLRELANDLERNMPDESDLDRELDAFISNALIFRSNQNARNVISLKP